MQVFRKTSNQTPGKHFFFCAHNNAGAKTCSMTHWWRCPGLAFVMFWILDFRFDGQQRSLVRWSGELVESQLTPYIYRTFHAYCINTILLFNTRYYTAVLNIRRFCSLLPIAVPKTRNTRGRSAREGKIRSYLFRARIFRIIKWPMYTDEHSISVSRG